MYLTKNEYKIVKYYIDRIYTNEDTLVFINILPPEFQKSLTNCALQSFIRLTNGKEKYYETTFKGMWLVFLYEKNSTCTKNIGI